MATMTREEFRKQLGTANPTPTTTKPKVGLGSILGSIGKELVRAPITLGTDTQLGLTRIAGAAEKALGLNDRAAISAAEANRLRTQGIGGGFAKTDTKPSQVVGNVLKTAALVAPLPKFVPKVGLLPKAAALTTRTAAFGGIGYATDVGSRLADGASPTDSSTYKPGIGTAINAALPVLGAATRAGTYAAREGIGVLTGAGGGAVHEASRASFAGGTQRQAFLDSLRGKTSPEEIVDTSKAALNDIIANRNAEYKAQVAKLADNSKTFDHAPVIEKFNKMLQDFNVTFQDGVPDFSRSPGLGRYSKDLKSLSETLANWGTKEGDNTVLGIDNLKQVIDDYRIGSADSRKFDAFVTALRNQAQGLIKDQPGYSKLVGDYSRETGLIKDITKGLSLGDKVQTDTAFRKLTNVLRTNNEFRRQLVSELDKESGGVIAPMAAGQQLSELTPRGLAKYGDSVLGGIGAGAAFFAGAPVLPMLGAALFTSPRIVGEILAALGKTGPVAVPVLKALQGGAAKVPWHDVFPNEEEPASYSLPVTNLRNNVANTISPIQNATDSINDPNLTTPQSRNGTTDGSSISPNSMTREQFRQQLQSGQLNPPSSSSSSTGPVSISTPPSSRLAYVNKNPGNLKFVGQKGAVPGEKGFARFPSLQAGFNALVNQVKLDASRGLTLAAFIHKFAPPSENDTKLYITQLATRLGINPNAPIKSINPVQLAKEVAKKESSTQVA